jgi:hypothetical protein
MTRTWFEPEKLADENETIASISVILDGRFLLYEYEGSVTGQAMVGKMWLGHNPQGDQYEAAWIDSFHMDKSIMFLTAPAREDIFTVSGEYPDPSGGPAWGWRTEFELESENRLLVRSYNIPPGYGPYLAVETVFDRV